MNANTDSIEFDDLFGLGLGSLIGTMFSHVAAVATLAITKDADISIMVGILVISLYMAKWWWNITQRYVKEDVWEFW